MDAAAEIVVELCMGSACFARGNKRTVDILTAFVKDEQLQDQIKIQGAFCEGLCSKGPVVKINGVACFGQSGEELMVLLRQLVGRDIR